jgi:hypothetical protein
VIYLLYKLIPDVRNLGRRNAIEKRNQEAQQSIKKIHEVCEVGRAGRAYSCMAYTQTIANLAQGIEGLMESESESRRNQHYQLNPIKILHSAVGTSSLAFIQASYSTSQLITSYPNHQSTSISHQPPHRISFSRFKYETLCGKLKEIWRSRLHSTRQDKKDSIETLRLPCHPASFPTHQSPSLHTIHPSRILASRGETVEFTLLG